jgi:hypothetical protein
MMFSDKFDLTYLDCMRRRTTDMEWEEDEDNSKQDSDEDDWMGAV